MSLPEPRILEWYRTDPWPAMQRVLLLGATLLTTGGLVIGVSFLASRSLDLRLAATVGGFSLVALGGGFTILGMHRILRREVSLVLRTDGVAVQSATTETLVAWDDLGDVRWDPVARALHLERAGGEPLIFARPRPGPLSPADGPALAARVLQLKRRSALHLRS